MKHEYVRNIMTLFVLSVFKCASETYSLDNTKKREQATFPSISTVLGSKKTIKAGAPEEKRRFLARRAQETKQRRALFNAETDAEEI